MIAQLLHLALFLIAAFGGPSQDQDGGAREVFELEHLRFMSGCWEGEFRGREGEVGTMEEYYTTPSRNVMLGTTRYLLDGRAVAYEFSLLSSDSAGIFLRPYPNGKASEDDFRLTELVGERAVFESPEHDYPKRILYWTEQDGTRVARIDGGADDPGGTEWRLARAGCG